MNKAVLSTGFENVWDTSVGTTTTVPTSASTKSLPLVKRTFARRDDLMKVSSCP
jgi:hypothetical protein